MSSIILKKHFTDEEMRDKSGTYFNIEDDWIFLENKNDENIKIFKPDNTLLAVIKRGAISSELCDIAINSFLDTKNIHTNNRGIASGDKNRQNNSVKFEKTNPVHSSIIGYIDSPNHKRPCRLTSYSKKYFEKYKKGISFIQRIDSCFNETIEDAYKKQKEFSEIDQVKDFIIENTAFSTVTVNYNFRTALHKDTGDYKEGFGNLVVCTKNIKGGHILFPQYKLAIQLYNGDFLAMDVHEWHCNSEIILENPENTNDSYRLSFVCYLREKMIECKNVNENLKKIIGDLDGKKWDTSILFTKIFEILGENIPKKEFLIEDKPWWKMQGEYITLFYKNKRYYLDDYKNSKRINNLIPSWNYVRDNLVISANF